MAGSCRPPPVDAIGSAKPPPADAIGSAKPPHASAGQGSSSSRDSQLANASTASLSVEQEKRWPACGVHSDPVALLRSGYPLCRPGLSEAGAVFEPFGVITFGLRPRPRPGIKSSVYASAAILTCCLEERLDSTSEAPVALLAICERPVALRSICPRSPAAGTPCDIRHLSQ